VNDVEHTWVTVTGSEVADTSLVLTRVDEHLAANLELHQCDWTLGGEVNLDSVKDLGVWVRVPHRGAVVAHDEWNATWTHTGLSNPPELVLCLLSRDLEWNVPSLCVVQQTEVLVRLWDADDIHEAGWEGEVGSGSTVNKHFMDVVSIPKTDENFRLLYDTKGRYVPLKISAEEAKYKLGRVTQSRMGPGGVPFIVCHDGTTMRYPDPNTKVLDTVKIDLATKRPVALMKFEIGCQVFINSGKNKGRIGNLAARDRHPGMFDIVHVKDKAGNTFATRLKNCFVIGNAGDKKAAITLPKGSGVKLSIAQERDQRISAKSRA
jgi:small subunit ribosomal protein S4e